MNTSFPAEINTQNAAPEHTIGLNVKSGVKAGPRVINNTIIGGPF